VATCLDCAAGTFTDFEGAVVCTLCAGGKHSGQGASSCDDCGQGTYSNPGSTSCESCDQGYVSEGSGNNACQYCGIGNGEGQFSSSAGAATCSTAPAGTKPTSDRQGTENCSPGRYSTGGADECSECGIGETSDVGAAGCRTCATCGLGKYQIAECTSASETQCRDCVAGKASMGGAVRECTRCDGPGEYSEPKASVCKTVPAGYKPTVTGGDGLKTGTEICPRNTFSIGAADECTVCADGGHSNPGDISCEKCSTGKYYNEPTNNCQLCPKNTFSISGATDINGCEDCPIGGHSQPGAGYCDQCLTGKYYDEPINSCQLCPKNTFSVSGATDINGCEDCPAGGHSQPGAGYCNQCLSGKYYDEPTNVCKLCLAGKYTATGGASIDECLSCDDGFYSSNPGSSTCFTCTPGKFTSTDQTECLLCPAGKISGVAASTCSVCEKGKYAEGTGNTECKFCDDDEMLLGSISLQNGTTSASGCICPAGEYVHFKENTCQNVPDGVETTVQAMTVKSLEVMPGYWRTNASSSEILPCLSPEHCLGGPDPATQCKEGHAGPLCAVCADGYASTGSGMFLKCSTCEGGDAVMTIALGFSAFFSIMFLAMWLTCCCLRKTKKKKKKKSEYEDEDDRAGLSNNDSLSTNKINKKLSKIDGLLTAYNEARPYGKIMLSYYQIVGGISFSFAVNFPPMFTKLMSVVSSVVNVEFINMMPLGCVMKSSFHHTLLIYTLVPFFAGVAMMIAYAILKHSGRVEASNNVYGWFLFMTFLILPTVSTNLFSTFACHEFDSGYGSYLKVDYSIDCASDEHKFYKRYAGIFVIVYVLGIPTLYAWNLWRVRQLLDPGQRRLAKRNGAEEGIMMAIKERKRLEEEHPHMKSLVFLYDSYEPQYFWFELVETLRKIMLTGGLVVLGSGTLSQIIISQLICLVAMRIFAGCKPFIKDKVDVFSEMSQWQILFVLLAALLLRIAEMSEGFEIPNKGVFDLILVATQILAPAMLIVMVLMKGKDATEKLVRKVTKSMSGVREADEEESGLEQAEMNMKSRTVLGGGGDDRAGRGGVRSSKFEVESPFSEKDREKLRLKQLRSVGPKEGTG
ncbi:hypothetical protein TrLO_g2474, partial [Triparma laevis f. longispina]